MFLEDIVFFNYRNLVQKKITPSKGLNLILGDNGQGKTNFLEAIFLLGNGKMFRPGTIEKAVNKTENTVLQANVKANFVRQGLDNQIQLKIDGSRRKILVNEKNCSASKLQGLFPVVLFSPESLSIVKDSDSARRDLLDQLVLSIKPEKSDLYANFSRLMRQKAKLLKDAKDNALPAIQAKAVIKSLNTKFLPMASEVTLLRLQALQQILPFLEESLSALFTPQSVGISVDYVISGTIANEMDFEAIFNATYKRLAELEAREWASGRCLVGPHKHDVQFVLNGENLRFFGSQGQQRSVILAFKMGQVKLHYETHKFYPVLLLDDVLSELDKTKRERLLDFLESIQSQVFLTATETNLELWQNMMDTKTFMVTNGKITEDKQSKSIRQGASSV